MGKRKVSPAFTIYSLSPSTVMVGATVSVFSIELPALCSGETASTFSQADKVKDATKATIRVKRAINLDFFILSFHSFFLLTRIVYGSYGERAAGYREYCTAKKIFRILIVT